MRDGGRPTVCRLTHGPEGAKAQLERPNDQDNRARATAPSNGRRTRLRALRLIRLFGRAQNPSTDEETREERESGREATPRERTVGGEHVEGRRSGRRRGATAIRVPSREVPRPGLSASRATW